MTTYKFVNEPKIPFREMEMGNFFQNENKEECRKIWTNKYMVYEGDSAEPLRIETCDPNTLFQLDWDWTEYIQEVNRSLDEQESENNNCDNEEYE